MSTQAAPLLAKPLAHCEQLSSLAEVQVSDRQLAMGSHARQVVPVS
jgi:hypothetical protein